MRHQIFMPQLSLPPKSAAGLFVIGLGIGVLLTIQFRTPPQRIINPLAPFLAVEQTHAALKNEHQRLKEQVKNLRREISQTQDEVKNRKGVLKNLVEAADALKIEAGLTELVDQGIIITLDDSRKSEATVDSIIHAADLRDIVNALWFAGARAVTINDERLVSSSSIDSIVNTILVNNVRMNPPFAIKALGPSDTLQSDLNSAETLVDLRNRAKNLGIVFTIEKTPEVNIKEFNGTFSITHAKINK
jgi:uncharacterized protein YlxW (UPF0749 family)